jgi:hypothetical protein
VPAMTYAGIYNAVLGRRFPASTQTTNAKRWVDTAYQDVWSADDWTFKRMPYQALAVVAGNNQPTMPADFGREIDLYDNFGTQLVQMDQSRFERMYLGTLVPGGQGQFGTPSAYMVANRQIYLSQPPVASTNYYLSYQRRMAHKNSGGTVVSGPMSADTDVPLWDDHHAILITRATVIGLIEINDPSWKQQQDEYERQLDRMKKDYVERQPAVQWGAMNWDA